MTFFKILQSLELSMTLATRKMPRQNQQNSKIWSGNAKLVTWMNNQRVGELTKLANARTPLSMHRSG